MSRLDVNRSLILGDGSGSPSQCRRLGCRLLFRQPRLANPFQRPRQVRRMRNCPFDGETGIDAAGFRQGRLGLLHLAFERVGGGAFGLGREESSVTPFA